nr:AraC family transcriptional regulator [Mucilaginibacter sp. L294]
MGNAVLKRRNGFEGERSLTLPQKVCKNLSSHDYSILQIFATQIGYFPKASFHYRERRKGCEDNILIYCLQGKGHYIFGNKRYVVTANQYILLPATEQYMRYWADIQDPWTIYWVHFTGKKIKEFNTMLPIATDPIPLAIPFNQLGIDLWNKIYTSLEMGYSRENLLNANFFLYSFVATFLFPEGYYNPLKKDNSDIIDQTIDFMHMHIDKRLSVREMSAERSISDSYLTKLFRKSTGMAPMDYFIHLKMQKACQLLHADNVKIKDVAFELGYDDPYYFSRLFKRYMGTSPEPYRQLSKK